MQTVALIVGHSAKSQGATNKTYGTSEYQFNEPLAHLVAEKLLLKGYTPLVIYRDSSYRKLPGKVNKTGADIAVSFHCNASDSDPHGSETLYYKGSSQGFLLASCIQEEIVKCLGLKDRGLKPCRAAYKGKAGDRGGYLLKKTDMPCITAEPFFIDSDSSLELANYKFNELAEAYAIGIARYLRG